MEDSDDDNDGSDDEYSDDGDTRTHTHTHTHTCTHERAQTLSQTERQTDKLMRARTLAFHECKQIRRKRWCCGRPCAHRRKQGSWRRRVSN